MGDIDTRATRGTPETSEEQPSDAGQHELLPAILGCLRVEMRAEQLTIFPDNPSRALHGAMLRAIERVDPILSAEVHEAAETSLVCSPLVRLPHTTFAEPIGRRVEANERVWATITCLDRSTLVTLQAALNGLRWRELPIMIERPFWIEEIDPVSPPGSTFPAIVSYADLAAMAHPVSEITLGFTTPTYFRQGNRILPHPDAAAVFLSHFRRWRAFAHLNLPGIDNTTIRGGVYNGANRTGRVVQTTLRGQTEQGFVGTASYGIDGDDPFRRGIATLASYAAYCGTGARTAFGMGQTELLT